jgi:hypothetical protein
MDVSALCALGRWRHHEHRQHEFSSLLRRLDLGRISSGPAIGSRVVIDDPGRGEVVCVVATGMQQTDGNGRASRTDSARSFRIDPDSLRASVDFSSRIRARETSRGPPLTRS